MSQYPRKGLSTTGKPDRDLMCPFTSNLLKAGEECATIPIRVSPFRGDDKTLYYSQHAGSETKAHDATAEQLLKLYEEQQSRKSEDVRSTEAVTKQLINEIVQEDAGKNAAAQQRAENPGAKGQHILSFEVSNVKRVELVQLTLEGKSLVIGGMNDNGKSSTLDALWYALGGQREIPAEPLRRGAKNGHATLVIDEYVITRKFTPKGTTLHVTTRDGTNVTSPQAVLDGLISKLSDPLKFLQMDEKQQGEEVRKAAGLDFTELDKKRATIYNERHSIGQEVTRLKGAFEKAPQFADAPQTKVTVSQLTQELEDSLEQQKEIQDVQGAIDDLESRATLEETTNADRWRSRIEELKKELAKAEDALAECQTKAQKCRADAIQYRDRLKQLPQPADVGPIRQKIKDAEELNAKFDANEKRRQLEKEWLDKQAEYSARDKDIEQIDYTKAQMTSRAKFPVKGISFAPDGGLRFNDLALKQASQAQQIDVSIALAMMQNPKLRVLWVRQGALLDPDYLALIIKVADEFDVQLLIERVGKGPECGVIIEEGQVSENRLAGVVSQV